MATSKKKTSKVTRFSSAARVFISVGWACIFVAFLILGLTYYPILREEFLYRYRHVAATVPGSKDTFDATPIDRDFGIVIPKLGANARVIPNVDPYDEKAYQTALAKGVAHARGTAYPGQTGSMFLFSHSSVDFYRATQFNSVFYLLNKLETDDEIDVYYQDAQYTYRVTGKKIVEGSDVSYLSGRGSGKTLILMTCWPPGTSLKRLLVFAEIVAQ